MRRSTYCRMQGDLCIHRSLPLFEGTVAGDANQYGYHGLRFDGTGKSMCTILSRMELPEDDA